MGFQESFGSSDNFTLDSSIFHEEEEEDEEGTYKNLVKLNGAVVEAEKDLENEIYRWKLLKHVEEMDAQL